MKVIVTLIDGKVDQVERYKDTETTINKFLELQKEKLNGSISENHSYVLSELSIFDD